MVRTSQSIALFQKHILNWYDQHQRDLPWRLSPSNPYYTLLSEFMLQQTIVATVIPYFYKFIKKWPDLKAFAQASEDEVLAAWAGLGYYSRARNLHKAAHILCESYDAVIPESVDELQSLPGIGPYTAAAIAAFAYDKAEIVVDGNIDRIMIRLFAYQEPKKEIKHKIYEAASMLTPQKRPGDYAQALMDLGAMICRPKAPLCLLCPVKDACQAFKQSITDQLPTKPKKKVKPIRFGNVYVAKTGDKISIEKRDAKGLFANMYQCPTSQWSETFEMNDMSAMPFPADWILSDHKITHIFTHFELRLNIYIAKLETEYQRKGLVWVPMNQLDEYALPSLMQKVIAASSQ